ncbi:MAG: DUF1592 domain-containing protein [Deltaproteobacteria bacterium]|nr:DUF1592 domain-containing protein [Deltaproteobacteria bacterium]
MSGCYRGTHDLAGSGDDSGTDAGSEDEGESPTDGDDAQCVEGPWLAPQTRRLSHDEYRNTLVDLFAPIELPALTLVEDAAPLGFDNTASALRVNALLVEQYETAATNVAEAAVASLDVLLPCEADDRSCPQQFIREFGARAFRRPLSEDDEALYLEFFESRDPDIDFAGRVQLVVAAMLQSPYFLYRAELGQAGPDGELRATDYEVASRMSYLLWQSMPDDALFAAAAAGELSDPDRRREIAVEMLAAARAPAAVGSFHRQWLELDALELKPKDPTTFPDFDEDVRASMGLELRSFIDYVVFDGEGTLAALLTDPHATLDARTASIYGVTVPDDGMMHAVDLDPGQRAGVLTRAAFLATHAYPRSSSPPRRGKFVIERLLCSELPPPPGDADLTPPEPAPGTKTNRELFEEKTAEPHCSGCHQALHGIGFGFEHYDAIGQYQVLDSGLPVDASGQLLGSDVDGPFEGAVELSQRLATSEDVEACMTRQWFRFAYGRAETSEDECRIEQLHRRLDEADGSIQTLLLDIIASDDFTRVSQGDP